MSPQRLRVTAVLAVAAALLGSLGGAGASGSGQAGSDLPTAGCQTTADERGDTRIGFIPVDDPDLDLLSLTLRSTSTSFVAYIKVADLSSGPAIGDGHRFAVTFVFGGHTFQMAGSGYRLGTGAVRDALAATGQVGGTTQLAVFPPTGGLDEGYRPSGLKVKFIPGHDYVVLDLPTADITKYAGVPFTGQVTNVAATSYIDAYATEIAVDSTSSSSWTIGDNACFPQQTAISFSVGKLPATRTVTATLTAAGQPLAGQPLAITVNGVTYGTVWTGVDGTATAVTNIKPGRTVTAQFHAITGYQGATASTKV